jgi:hypothetical protein
MPSLRRIVGYREQIDRWYRNPPPVPPETAEKVRRVCAGRAEGLEDLRMLLEALGLLDQPPHT